MGFITKLDISTSCDFGSQMMQYASLLAISEKTGLNILFIDEYIKQRWGFPLNQPFKNTINTLPISDINNSDIRDIDIDINQPVDERLFHLNPNQNYNIIGLFNTYDIFHPIQEKIIELFTFKDAIHLFNIEMQIVPIAGDYIKYNYILYKVIERGFEVFPATAIRLYVEETK
jgi:hypothetical protein